MIRDQLTRMFEELVAEHGKDWKRIADLLNSLGARTFKGTVWTRDGARSFYRSSVTKDRGISQSPPRPSATIPHILPEWLDDDAWQDLHEMLRSWKARNNADVVQPQYRPMFRGNRRNSGIHVNEIILQRAMKKAKLDRARTGGSLSRLVEFLLWQYIGSPTDVLEPLPPNTDSDSQSRQD
jgi:hypothetical protein